MSGCGRLTAGRDLAAVFAAFGADETMKGMERQSKNPKTTLGIFLDERFVDFGSSI
jgi:hypothetical protein